MYPVAGRRVVDMDFPLLMTVVWTKGPYVIHGFKRHEQGPFKAKTSKD